MHDSGFNSLADFFFPFTINSIIRTIGNLTNLCKARDFSGTTLAFEILNIQGKSRSRFQVTITPLYCNSGKQNISSPNLLCKRLFLIKLLILLLPKHLQFHQYSSDSREQN